MLRGGRCSKVGYVGALLRGGQCFEVGGVARWAGCEVNDVPRWEEL